MFDDGRVAGIETMGGPATPQELLAVIRHMRWHTAVQPEAEDRAILDVVAAAREWVDFWRAAMPAGRRADALVAAVDALPPQAPPEAPEAATERPARAQGGVIPTAGWPRAEPDPVEVFLPSPGLMRTPWVPLLPEPAGPFRIREGDEPGTVVHEYVSTACQHDRHDYCAGATRQDGGDKVPMRCKWCPALCRCQCHARLPEATVGI
jgi:hypothetical protein